MCHFRLSTRFWPLWKNSCGRPFYQLSTEALISVVIQKDNITTDQQFFLRCRRSKGFITLSGAKLNLFRYCCKKTCKRYPRIAQVLEQCISIVHQFIQYVYVAPSNAENCITVRHFCNVSLHTARRVLMFAKSLKKKLKRVKL